MSTNGADLLRLLGGSASPQARIGGVQTRAGVGGAGGPDFAGLLSQAQRGELASGREVTVAKKAGVTLSAEQLQKIAAAADQAEAQGATRALVLVDGLAVRLDVTMREVTGQVNLGEPGVLADIDAVVNIPGARGEGGDGMAGEGVASVLPLPKTGAATGNASLLKTLSKVQNSDDRAA